MENKYKLLKMIIANDDIPEAFPNGIPSIKRIALIGSSTNK